MLSAVTKFLLIALFYRCSGDEVEERFYPRYHLSAPHGWMNDPNGFCKFQNWNHLFYQYNPETSQEAGVAHWGHAKSEDLITWYHLPIAMTPDEPYDITGVFSGSAMVENNTMFLLYTGNVRNPGQTPEVEQRQALASSTDGVHFTKYAGNPVIKAEEHQPDIRDPKVWKHGDLYYMVLGNSINGTLGQILLYSSKDLISWIEVSTLAQSDGFLGHMWECPDFFELGGYFILLFSPQGMEPCGDKYKNLYQTGYIVGNFDYKTNRFEPITKFRELDHGHDFYATQTMMDGDCRVVIAWEDMWDNWYPERDDGFTGQMTIPRELILTDTYGDLRLLQKPVKAISAARGRSLYSGEAQGGHTVQLEDKAGEIKITASKDQDFNLFIESINASVSISYDMVKHKVTLDRGGEDGVRRTHWKPADKLEWHILVDASSIELFCGNGEVTFTSRFFPYGDITIRLGDHVQVDNFSVTSMKRTVPFN